MDENELLLGIEAMRRDGAYQSAEALRRKTKNGAAGMAGSASNSAEKAAIQLLLSTWDAIAVLLKGAKSKDKIYEVTPICHMYDVLEPAIQVFRKETPEFAVEFESLNKDYQAWLKKKKKSGTYVSAVCGGLMHARFG